LRVEIAAWDVVPVHVSIFGSAARGDGDTTSDIDIFIVRPRTIAAEDSRWREQLARLSAHVLEWTGNHAGLSEISETDTRRLRREHPRIVEELGQDAITIAGPEATELLRARR
jgi:hypothetical protein